jgi:hypothetical protein
MEKRKLNIDNKIYKTMKLIAEKEELTSKKDLINVPEYEGEKAFDWEKEFKETEKILKVCIDSNILFDYFREESESSKPFQLIQLANAKKIFLRTCLKIKFKQVDLT